MSEVRGATALPVKRAAPAAAGLTDLVNRLAQELAEARRALAAATQKLGTTSRTLEGRTHELTEARAALAMLLATLDCATDGILAVGYFGRAMHYNTRFVEMWGIPEDKLSTLDHAALMAMQLAHVRDPSRFLSDVENRKANPDAAHLTLIELRDGRIFECHAMPQRVRGKRVGTVATYRDVTETARLGQLDSSLHAEPGRSGARPKMDNSADATTAA
jgi:PAS domain S-box-containing protein